MLNSKAVDERRVAHAAYLKSLREMYGIRFTSVQKETGMSTRTLYTLEKGFQEWKIDSEIQYLMALNAIIDRKRESAPKLKLPDRPPLLQLYYTKHHSHAPITF